MVVSDLTDDPRMDGRIREESELLHLLKSGLADPSEARRYQNGGRTNHGGTFSNEFFKRILMSDLLTIWNTYQPSIPKVSKNIKI